jgi:hypothetical protein
MPVDSMASILIQAHSTCLSQILPVNLVHLLTITPLPIRVWQT